MNDNVNNQKHCSTDLKSHYEQMLQNIIFATEMSMDLKDRAEAGEKYISNLRKLVLRASRAIATINNSSKNFVLLSRKLTTALLKNLEKNCTEISDPELSNLRSDYERLANFLDKESMDIDVMENIVDYSLANDSIRDHRDGFGIAERLRNLEIRRLVEQNCNLPQTLSARSFRSDVDEKYPDNWSKDSSISLNNVVNLPPVPEDAFTSFSRPTRTSSLSSLKSIRKVKLFLQRNVTSEDEESECDDHELSMSGLSDPYQDDPPSSSEGGETKSVALSVRKARGLCNIKEETPQDH